MASSSSSSSSSSSGGGAPGLSDRLHRAQRLQRGRVLHTQIPPLGRIHPQNLRKLPQQRIIILILIIVFIVVGGKPIAAQRIQRPGNPTLS